jgi:hydroxymethylpyrimidine kinase/phosphomethylpyrimidine kinase
LSGLAQGVRQIYPVDSQEMIKNTLDAVFEDIGVDAVKTGMLTTVDTVKTVISRLQKYHTGKHLIVDPVMVSTSGARLISEEAIDTYIEQLFPLASLITPNLIEAIFIHSRMSKSTSKYSLDSIKDLYDVEILARKLHSLGCRSVLIKGGHGVFTGHEGSALISEPVEGSSRVVDVFYDGKEFKHISTSYVESKNTHGTGCTLACKY